MSINWKLFRIVCILQMTAAVFLFLISLLDMIRYGTFTFISRTVVYLLVVALAIFAVTTLNNNYPEAPITGRQKKLFNRLFLVNFIFLAFQFGFLFSAFKNIRNLCYIYNKTFFELPFEIVMTMVAQTTVLILQFVVFYGLYELRRILNANFTTRMFEFEKE